jgi:hypothetical protein
MSGCCRPCLGLPASPAPTWHCAGSRRSRPRRPSGFSARPRSVSMAATSIRARRTGRLRVQVPAVPLRERRAVRGAARAVDPRRLAGRAWLSRSRTRGCGTPARHGAPRRAPGSLESPRGPAESEDAPATRVRGGTASSPSGLLARAAANSAIAAATAATAGAWGMAHPQRQDRGWRTARGLGAASRARAATRETTAHNAAPAVELTRLRGRLSAWAAARAGRMSGCRERVRRISPELRRRAVELIRSGTPVQAGRRGAGRVRADASELAPPAARRRGPRGGPGVG